MLGIICTLITVLTYVSCHKQVTQTPPVLTVNEQQTAEFGCDISRDDGHYASWYKQVPGGAPQYVLRFHHSHSSPNEYGSGFSSDRFTSNAQSDKDYRLIINNVEKSDSAVYYCCTWDTSANENVHSDLHHDKNLLTKHFCFLGV